MMREKTSSPELMNASDRAYQKIYDMIITGEARPGDRLLEVELSKTLGASRTPIRAALGRLIEHGLVESNGRSHVVTKLDLSRVRDVYEFRAALEALAARLAAERSQRDEFSLATFAELHEINDNIEAAAARSDVRLVSRHNMALHHRISELADNEFLIDATGKITDIIAISGASIFKDERWGRKVHLHHSLIIDAIVAGDPERASSVAREHVLNARHVYTEIATQFAYE